MEAYRLKHRPTGLYYKPGAAELSANGKVYMTSANILSYTKSDIIPLRLRKQSRAGKKVLQTPGLRYKDAGSEIVLQVPRTDFEKEVVG